MTTGPQGRVAGEAPGRQGGWILAEDPEAPGASWRAVPPLSAGRTVTLALPAAGTTDALAATGSSLTIWQLGPGSAAWAKAQAIKVPIQYGSSG